jgi:dihydropteroate synthase
VAGLPVSRIDPRLPVVWGVLNVTPDSFSDGGRFAATDTALEQGVLLVEYGADVVDVGGESTRPGAERVSIETELERVLPVVSGLVDQGVTVSIDTMRADVAREAVRCGASIVNDVSGGRADAEMHSTVAELDVPYVLMHWRAHSSSMQERAVYDDPVAEVCREIEKQVSAALASGVDRERIIVDPGIGFAKEADHNWHLLRSMEALATMGFPILVGASRKRFLGALLADTDGVPRDADGRDVATAVLSAQLANAGAWGLRVHDVLSTVDALKVLKAMTFTDSQPEETS